MSNVSSLFILVTLVTVGLGAQTSEVDSNRLVHAEQEPGNWLMYSGQYHSQRFSRLDQITRSNVSELELRWVRQLPTCLLYTSPSPRD